MKSCIAIAIKTDNNWEIIKTCKTKAKLWTLFEVLGPKLLLTTFHVFEMSVEKNAKTRLLKSEKAYARTLVIAVKIRSGYWLSCSAGDTLCIFRGIRCERHFSTPAAATQSNAQRLMLRTIGRTCIASRKQTNTITPTWLMQTHGAVMLPRSVCSSVCPSHRVLWCCCVVGWLLTEMVYPSQY